MRYLFSISLVFCLMSVTLAQNAENIRVTESSTMGLNQFLDDIVPNTLTVENRVLPYEFVRSADVPWKKKIWRVIDVREKMNLPFAYPVMPLFSILSEAAKNGDITAFKEETFENMMLPDDIDQILYSIDSVEITDPNTYETTVQVVPNELNPEDIQRYRVKEIWFFDKETSRMKVRILGIAPVKEEYDEETGILKYELPLFWVYYPEARETLAKFKVFNPFNDAAPMTWDMLFEERFFSSYIYKESNVLDDQLKNIVGGQYEVLLESQKIKDKLFNFEHDLWSY